MKKAVLFLSTVLLALSPSIVLADSVVGWGGQKVFDISRLKGLVAISASDFHSLALKSDGSIVGWGRDHYGQASPPLGNDFIAIAAGGGELPLRDCGHSIALKSNGSIVAWGIDDGSSGDFGQVSDTPDSNDFVAISAGYNYNIALKSDGFIVGWGIDDGGWADCGQVSDTPDGNDFTAIAAGIWHNLALRSDGSIVGWGDDDYGQASPPLGNDFIAIAVGASHSLALKSDGSIVAWGIDNGDEYFDYGQVTDTPEGNDFVAIAAGLFHCLALKSDGSIVGWGGSTNWLSESMPSSSDYIAIAAGGAHNLALRPDGSIVGWGDNWSSQAAPPAGDDYTEIAAGGWHGLSLKSDGSIFGWGENLDPLMTPDGNDFIAVAAGESHSLALKSDGSIIGWGSDYYGQATPPTGNDFTAIAAGDRHGLAIKSDGSIVIWGGGGQPTSRAGDYTAIAAGGTHTIALKSDGSIIGWGSEPPDGNDFEAISAGWAHSLALKSDGSIVAWGIDDDSWYDYGQVRNAPAGNNFIAIAAGEYHSLALKTDGSIVGWGDNLFGQVNIPEGNNFTAISAGIWHNIALVAETNNKPVADAGENQTVFACANGILKVKLDGSGSFDADGDELEYFWFEGGEQIATGVDPNVLLTVGQHTIELIVNDVQEDSEPNEVLITVVGPIGADVHIVPRVINRRNRLKRIIAIMRLPQGIGRGDIADEPFVITPGGIESTWQRVIGARNRMSVFILFDKAEVMDALPNTGRFEINVIGKLESGQCISGRDKISIIQPRRRMRYRRKR